MTDNCLPSDCILRRATVGDIWTIRKLVLSAHLDFTQLRLQQFWLIEQEKKKRSPVDSYAILLLLKN